MGTTPKRSWVDSIGVKSEHVVVKFVRRRGYAREVFEVADVFAGRFNVEGLLSGVSGPCPAITMLGLRAAILSIACSQASRPRWPDSKRNGRVSL